MSLFNCSTCVGSGWSGYNETQCYRITTSAATAPSTPLTVLDTGYDGYSISGSFFYEYLPPSNSTITQFFNVPTLAIINGNSAWDNVALTTTDGPLNRVAGWPTLGPDAQPYDTWLGFTTCLSGFTEEKTYWIGIGGDNLFRLKLDGDVIVETPAVDTKAFNRWNVYPVVIGAGNHTLELYGLNTGTYAGFGCEIYDADLATLTGLTTYAQVQPYIKFTSSGQTLYDVVQDTNGNYLSSGYTCSGGYTYSICDNACVKYEYCTNPCQTTYCIRNTGYPQINDIYSQSSSYNGKSTWTGTTNGYYIFYKSATTQWCLSNVLNGNCLLSGKSPCLSNCPDFFDEYIKTGICPTPTPSVTNCNQLDFESYFDCEGYFCLSPTPTKTPTQTPTPTTNNTITCTINVDATLVSVSVTPTQTPTQTPTSSGIFSRDCTFLGNVLFNTINVNLNCPISKKFSDCNNPNNIYTTTNTLINPGGGNLTENMIFNAKVNGSTKCIKYLGLTEEIIGGDTIILIAGPIGSCSSCSPTSTPTKTPTQTPSNTPSPTVTPSITPTKTPTKSVTPTRTPTRTAAPTQTPTKSPTPTPTPTKTPI